jgi:fibronectin type 3 domain-containing protein
MVVTGYYPDGTSGVITDYQILGFDNSQVGVQTVIVFYQNQMAAFSVNIIPAKVTNVTVSGHDTMSYTLTWDAAIGVSRYEVYCLDDLSGTYYLINYAYTNSITFYYSQGTVHSYKIREVDNVLGLDYSGDFSDVCVAATNPDPVPDLIVNSTTTSSITLSWSAAFGATGYLVYRSPSSQDKYELCGTADTTSYSDSGLTSGQSYKYKVCAFTYSDAFEGLFSPIADVSTNPAEVRLKYKAGDQKIRFTWYRVNGATSYDVYGGDELNGYSLLHSSAGNNGGTFIAQGLNTGSTYSFYAVAHRQYNGITYDSPVPSKLAIEMKPIEATSSTAKLFKSKEEFLNSWTYKTLPFFSQYVNYTRSYTIPGIVTTNVGGFSSIRMCPQGITFAEGYLLVSAYDISGEENSVIYVLKKSTKKLLTTIVLPAKPHAGGICYDGYNIWITNSSKVSSVPFSVIDAAARSGEPYVNVEYSSVIPLGIITSYVTYYDSKLWVGTYNELQSTKMYSYTIDNKETTPVLTRKDTIVMPTRVQGVAFTNIGTLILSRSCQLRKGLRGYMRQIDTYKPAYANAVDGIIPLGDIVNTVSMPSMNEGIAIDGSYLYVNFESGAFDGSTYKMDRICAFKLTDIVKKKKTA